MPLANDIVLAIENALRAEFSEETTHIGFGEKQDDPELDITVHWGGEKYMDKLNTTKRDETGSFTTHTYDFGGFHIWRTFRVEYAFHRTGDKADARIKMMDIESRSIRLLSNLRVASADPHENCVTSEYVTSYFEPSGGDGTWIWSGQIIVRFLTYIKKN